MSEPELIVGIVAPLGIRREALVESLTNCLKSVGYQSIHIRLSDHMKRLAIWKNPIGSSEATRIEHLQAIGNKFRETIQDGAALARTAIIAIRESRAAISGKPDDIAGRTVYLLDQLKHPAEVDLLREVYGQSFLLIAAHAPGPLRVKHLANKIAKSTGHAGEGNRFAPEAGRLVEIDDNQAGDFGQNTRDTYPLADYFVDLGVEGGEDRIDRFIELVFGNPFRTPMPEEYGMYQASAAALRSSDHSRQVGAAVATDDGEVIAVGCNEAPLRGGGLYWPGKSPDARDQALNEDRAAEIKASVLSELLENLDKYKLLAQIPAGRTMYDLAIELLPKLSGTKFMNIGEFGRTVHAEMAALIYAARRGVSVDDLTMYVTTFPCHNCAKHIVAAGIQCVRYLEPYPKSRADFLHREEIELDPTGELPSGKVAFAAYTGVAPRMYQQVFSMSARGRKKGLTLSVWKKNRATLVPRYVPKNAAHSYLASERQEIQNLSPSVFTWNLGQVCP